MSASSLHRESTDSLIVAIHFTSERGQPLYNGQNDPSQCVRYSEVPLYYSLTSEQAIVEGC